MAEEVVPEAEIWKMFWRIGENLRRVLAQKRPEYVLNKSTTLSQLKVIHHVVHTPDKRIRIKDLAALLDITSGGVSQIVNNLVRDGIVERRVYPEDRRVTWVVLSEKGENMRRQAEEIFNELTDRVMSEVDPERRAVFVSVLNDVNRRFAEL